MGNELSITPQAGPVIAEPTRLTTPLVSSALRDYAGRWLPQEARRVFEREHVDVPALIAQHESALAPVASDWLASRLKLLWKSSTPSGSLSATAWLHETGRLLSDLPHDIAAWAIDEAVKRSERGFMPSVGEIRALAEPKLLERRRSLGRLKLVRDCKIDRKPEPLAPEDRCTPEQAREIMERCGIKPDETDESRAAARAHRDPPRAPDRQWYLDNGVAPEDLPDSMKDQA
jgi:hypothetical protein